ncbi:MAG TPA: PEP-CTERM sorting domain-containing protein, partial [Methylomirabilota bacterium]|nr:PEP-CTERM sorting domain-containing protein [Methylomirabilota bacterium]
TFGQGFVNFANTPTTLILTNDTAFGTSGPMEGFNAYRIGLYVGPLGTPGSSLTLIGLATNSPAPFRGRFNGGTPYSLPGYAAGTPITFQIRAWDSSAGPTWESALVGADAFNNGGFMRGASALGFVTPTDGLSVVPDLFGTAAGQVQGFTLAIPIPEPSTWALSALAVLAVYFRIKRCG